MTNFFNTILFKKLMPMFKTMNPAIGLPSPS